MGWLTESERRILAVLGALALVAVGVVLWQRRTPPLVIEGTALRAVEGAAWDQALAAARSVDVNTAGVAELERLPQVGPSLAQRIVDDREAHGPFRSPEELSRVRGIGPKTVGALKDYVTTE